MPQDHDNDVLEPYYAFIFSAAVILVSLLCMPLAARQHDVRLVMYLKSTFRIGRRFKKEVGSSSLDILTFGILGSSVSVFVLGLFQLNFVATLITVLVLASVLGLKLLLCHKWSVIFPRFRPVTPDVIPASLTARNRYQDVTQPLARVAVSGVAQVLLLGVYVWSLFEQGRPAFDTARSYVFYLFGVFLVMAYLIGNDLYNGRRADYDFWKFFLYHAQTHRGQGHWRNGDQPRGRLHQISPLEADFRYLLDTVVNSIGLGCLQVAIPVQLAGGSDMTPLDFVLNVVAAFFIIELDDCEDKTLTFRELEEEPDHDLVVFQKRRQPPRVTLHEDDVEKQDEDEEEPTETDETTHRADDDDFDQPRDLLDTIPEDDSSAATPISYEPTIASVEPEPAPVKSPEKPKSSKDTKDKSKDKKSSKKNKKKSKDKKKGSSTSSNSSHASDEDNLVDYDHVVARGDEESTDAWEDGFSVV